MRTSRVHECFAQELCEPKPEKCLCRKLIELSEATYMVKQGEAQWLVVDRLNTGTLRKLECPICKAVPVLQKTCTNCRGTGFTNESVYFEKFHANDIVRTSWVDDEMDVRYAHAAKVPRTATIEKAHIERAYITEDDVEISRIEEYEAMTQELRASWIISLPYDWVDPTKDVTLFCFGADQRTVGGYDSELLQRATEAQRIEDEI